MVINALKKINQVLGEGEAVRGGVVAAGSLRGQARGLSEELVHEGGAIAKRREGAPGALHRSPGSGSRRMCSQAPLGAGELPEAVYQVILPKRGCERFLAIFVSPPPLLL